MTDISRDAALAHFGVKGMRWGVRKKVDGGESKSSKPAKRKYTTQEINDARAQVAFREGNLLEADRRVRKAANPKEKQKALADVEKTWKEYQTDPANNIAGKMTKGEKISTAILLAAGTVTLASLGVSAATKK